VKLAALAAAAVTLLGRSEEYRPIVAHDRGNGARTVLVVGCIHGDECAGVAVARRLLTLRVPAGVRLVVVPLLNPDGRVHGTRGNARGVDLNRNFPSEWRRSAVSGPAPASERETRIAMRLVERLRPALTVWFHQPQANVRAWGGSVAAARRYARLTGLPFRRLRWPPGSASNWQNHRIADAASFVVELPRGPLSARDADRHARAVLALARG
jgi:murein peptide amidase A